MDCGAFVLGVAVGIVATAVKKEVPDNDLVVARVFFIAALVFGAALLVVSLF